MVTGQADVARRAFASVHDDENKPSGMGPRAHAGTPRCVSAGIGRVQDCADARGECRDWFFGRLAVSLIALFLVGGLWSENIVGLAIGVVGVILLAASTGIVELAKALWYGHSRRRLTE